MDESSVVVTTADGNKLCFNPNSTASDILQVLTPGGGALRRTTDGRHYVGSNSVPEGDYALVLPPPTPPPVAAIVEDVELALERALKRSKSEPEVSISAMSEAKWSLLADAAGLQLQPIELHAVGLDSSKLPKVPAFSWSDEPEGQQADRYMAHLGNIFPLPQRTAYPLVWVKGGSQLPHLLDVVGKGGMLHYTKIRGNTDAAIVTRASSLVTMPQTGLSVLFELNKPSNMGSNVNYQAACQLVLANLKSPLMVPIVVITDLQDCWRLLFMNKTTVMLGSCERPEAVQLIRDCVAQAAALASSSSVTVSSSTVSSSTEMPSVHTLPAVLAERSTPFQPTCSLPGSADDLDDLLPEADQQYAQALAALSLVRAIPAFGGIASEAGDSPRPAMFS